MQDHHATIILTQAPEEYRTDVPVTTEVSHRVIDTIGIDTIRELITEAYLKPREGYDKKCLILSATKITSEAQQAALKILEEPPQQVSIIIVLPIGTQLLDTVLSRVEFKQELVHTSTNVFSGWLKLPYADRIAEIEKRIKDKDSLWLQSFKTDLQTYYTSNFNRPGTEVKEVQFVIENLLTRGASNKMLLEHLALSIPLTH